MDPSSYKISVKRKIAFPTSDVEPSTSILQLSNPHLQNHNDMNREASDNGNGDATDSDDYDDTDLFEPMQQTYRSHKNLSEFVKDSFKKIQLFHLLSNYSLPSFHLFYFIYLQCQNLLLIYLKLYVNLTLSLYPVTDLVLILKNCLSMKSFNKRLVVELKKENL